MRKTTPGSIIITAKKVRLQLAPPRPLTPSHSFHPAMVWLFIEAQSQPSEGRLASPQQPQSAFDARQQPTTQYAPQPSEGLLASPQQPRPAFSATASASASPHDQIRAQTLSDLDFDVVESCECGYPEEQGICTCKEYRAAYLHKMGKACVRSVRWPYGWKHSSNITCFPVHVSVVGPNMLEKIIECTLKHLGGTRGSNVYLEDEYLATHAQFFEAGLETEVCGHIMIALTKKPSKSKVFAGIGSRVYFRGVARAQQDLAAVKSWMTDIIVLTRV